MGGWKGRREEMDVFGRGMGEWEGRREEKDV